MKYVSTRGGGESVGFVEALRRGLAPDGGLYVPECVPCLSGLAGGEYPALVAQLVAPFVAPDISVQRLEEVAREVYGRFDHPEVVPVVQLGKDEWLMELFHGPTLAFKDVAMGLLAGLMREVGVRGLVLGATSGDTGAAAIEAFGEWCDVVMLYPRGRVAELQRKQMTATGKERVQVIAVDGTFDACQAMVKSMFMDAEVQQKKALLGINSINWGRVMGQIGYYAAAAASFGGEKVGFVVPTGNFGNLYAGHTARRMGVRVGRLVAAVNSNDILARVLNTGVYAPRGVVPTMSPSMDIEVASNFERVLWEQVGADGVVSMMGELGEQGAFQVAGEVLEGLQRTYEAGCAQEEETAATVRQVYEETGMLIDPHTAVGVHVGRRQVWEGPRVVLATAHAAKFAPEVEAACGVRPPLPGGLAALEGREEREVEMAADAEELRAFLMDLDA